mmetsp:Transcript_54912/g.157913  ORF Transcript_54912/g.157913 Transcript_54912/m.157913 type:complete len:206 (+) Transcript_54912:1001-1618(+)
MPSGSTVGARAWSTRYASQESEAPCRAARRGSPPARGRGTCSRAAGATHRHAPRPQRSSRALGPPTSSVPPPTLAAAAAAAAAPVPEVAVASGMCAAGRLLPAIPLSLSPVLCDLPPSPSWRPAPAPAKAMALAEAPTSPLSLLWQSPPPMTWRSSAATVPTEGAVALAVAMPEVMVAETMAAAWPLPVRMTTSVLPPVPTGMWS